MKKRNQSGPNRAKIKSPVNEIIKTERISLKVKLIISHILIAVVPILIIVITLTAQASSSILNKVNSSNLAYVSKTTKILDGNITSIENIVRIILADKNLNNAISKTKDDYDSYLDLNTDRKTNFDDKISALQFSSNMIKNIYLVKKDEVLGSTPLKEAMLLSDFVASDIYKNAQSIKMTEWYTNLFDTEDLFAIRAVNNLQTGKFIGVLVIQVKKNLISEDLNNDFGESAKVAIIDSTGQIIIAPEHQKPIKRIAYLQPLLHKISNQLANQETPIGIFTTTDELDEQTSVIYGNITNGWTYLLQIPLSETLGDINKIKSFSIILTGVIVIIAVLLGIWMALSISSPIDYIRKKIKLVEQGDLMVQSKYRGKYEIGQLSQSFNHMTENMKNLLQEASNVVEIVSLNSQELNKISRNSVSASKEVISAVESISNGAVEQARDAENTTDVVKELVSQFNATEDHFSFVVQATDKTREASKNSKATLSILNATTRETIELAHNIQKDINNLVQRFSEISSIIGMINEISEQSNLLSLNAAIEAARAGVYGRGFTVVADEVGRLAVRSSDAVKNISAIINSLNQDTSKTEALLMNSEKIFIKQEQAVENTEMIFNEVMSNMNTISNEVDLVYKRLEKLDSYHVRATDSIASIATIAEESAAAIEEVLASGQEQMASAEQLVHMSAELDDIIIVLGQQMKRFSI